MDELVACILSQHTIDANSYRAFDRLKAAYATWEQLANQPPEAVADVIRNAGLANQKARTIVRCLGEIRARTGGYDLDFLGALPLLEARAWLMDLPGVGPKTASLVLCFGFGRGAIPVDTHVFRVAWRYGLIEKKIGEAKAHDRLLELVPEDLAYRFHMAFIQHGRLVCKALRPRCETCAIRQGCRFQREAQA